MWNGDALLEKLYAEAVSKHLEQAKTEPLNERRLKLKTALRESIGSFEPNAGAVPKLLERVECGGYIRERVELSATPGLAFGVYVLMPRQADGPLPGVLALHGHGYGSREIVGLLPDGSPDEGQPGIHRHFAVELVKRGLAVIAPDVIGFGERRLLSDLARNPDETNSCYRLSTELMMLGKTLTGLRVAEALKAFHYLASRPEVDGSRIGAMGFSGGAQLGYVAAVLEAKIQAVVLTGFANTFKDSVLSVRHCIDNYTPGLLRYAELPELIGLIVPRPLFLESGERDPIFPIEGFRRAVGTIEAIYEAEDAAGRVAVDIFPGAHEICGRKAFDWLKAALST